MYSKTYKRFGVMDAVDSYSWIFEGLDRTDYQEMSDDDIYVWADQLIAPAKSQDLEDIKRRAEAGKYPRYGYTTAQVFNNAEEYFSFKLDELERDYGDEQGVLFMEITRWIKGQ